METKPRQLSFSFNQRGEAIQRTREYLLDELEWANVRGRQTESRKGLRWLDRKQELTQYSNPGNLFNNKEEHVLSVLKEAGITEADLENHGSELARIMGTRKQIKTSDGRVLKVHHGALHEAAAKVISSIIPHSTDRITKANPWGGNHWKKAILERRKLLKQRPRY